MSRLGKSFKNRFLRRALAMALAGMMVMSSMPVSLAAEQSNAKTSVESEVQERTEEAAEDGEVSQEETSPKAETQEQESAKSTEESKTVSKEETTEAETEKETKTTMTEASEIATAVETEVSETDTEETETEQTTEAEENEATYTSAAFASGNESAVWSTDYVEGMLLKSTGEVATDSTGAPVIQSGKKGIYKNKVEGGDILYIDTAGSNGNGKFAINSDKIQIRQNTKVYIPVKTDKNGKAKITIYQSNIKDQSNVIYKDNNTTNISLKISKDENVLSDVECTAFSQKGSYYQTELTVPLNDSNTVTAICVEVMNGDIYASKIISGEEVRDDIYDSNEGNDEALVKYNMEGFAKAYGVTGGGMLKKEKSESYHTVSNAVEFLEALTKVKDSGEPAVIEVIGDLNLGSKELGKDESGKDNLTKYSKLIKENQFQALWHPTLKESGVSDLTLEGFNNLTIFASNDKGAVIKHCNIIVKRSTNIVIRNLVFDELWEWDDGGTVEAEKKTYDRGGYDRNDWDYFCIDTESDGIWIDHCTFYKAYDGVIDVKNAKENGDERVTISWCKFEPKSAPDESGKHPFFDAQLEELEKDFKSGDPKAIYYKSLRLPKGEKFEYTYTKYSNKVGTETTETLTGEGYELEDIVTYTMGQKKTHLLGQSDGTKPEEADKKIPEKSRGIKVTLANNSYKNSMDRMPRLRFGVAHEYNCTLDSSELDAARKAGSKAKSHLVSNGAISTMGGYVFLENCYIDGIQLPLNSGNGESLRGYIGQTGSIYNYKNNEGEAQVLTVVNNSNDKSPDHGKEPLTLTKDQFEEKLPENYGSYQLCAADNLSTDVVPYAGAGSVKMTAVQWLKTSYGADNAGNNPDPDNPDNPNPDNPNPDNPDNPPAETNGKEFRASSLEVQAELTADLEVNEFYTITKGCEVAEGKATINDIYFTKYITLSAKGSKEHSIQITSPGKGTVTVYAAAGTTAAKAVAGTLNLLDETGNTVVDSTDITDAAAYTLQIPQKGVYYVASDDSEIHIYGIDLNAEEGGEEQEPDDEFSLRMDEIKVDGVQVAELTTDHQQNGFTIKASSTNKVEISDSSATVAGVKYTKRLRLSGTPSKDSYSIHFTTKNAGTLWVYAKNASSSGSKILSLKKVEGNSDLIKQREVLDKETAAVKYDIAEAGDYYIVPETKGIDVYYIGFTTKKEQEPEYTKPSRPTGDSVYDASEGANVDTAYNMEGYAASANVTGGGLLKEDSAHYYKATNEKEFLDALKKAQEDSKNNIPSVIEITTDLNLGNKELNEKYGLTISSKSEGEYSGVIRAYDDANAKNPQSPIMHPTLIDTGVSWIKMHNFHNLTIFSTKGASIKHAGITFEGGSSNIIIRNITFDELWEWDESTKGDYDRNDWDYMTIQDNATDIWVDHCTFYRAYDGILDLKNDSKYTGLQRVTVSWCEVLPGSKDPAFFDEQIDWLEEHIDETTYYKQLRETEKMAKEDVWWYAYGQKKAHLLGSGNGDTQDKAIRATFANNYWKNVQARLPRLRFGKAHIYNSVIDSAEMNAQHEKMKKEGKESHITGDAAISTLNGEMLLENCYIDGARTPLRSGRGSVAGYINTDNCLYYMNGSPKELTITEYVAGTLKETNVADFREKLPYTYNKEEPSTLKERLQASAGAGKLTMTAVQWERTSYNGSSGGEGNPDDPNPPVEPTTIDAPTALPAEEAQFPSTGGEVTLDCTTDGATIYYTMSEAEAGLTDPADATNANRVPYNKETKIQITKETYIWAVAVKDDKASEPLKCHYTVLAEGAVARPIATPGSSKPVATGTKVTLSAMGEFDSIYYTKGATPDTTADPTKKDSGREPFNSETGIIITEAVTIKAVAKKGNTYSDVATFTYTIKTDTPDDGKKVKSPVADPAAGAVKKGTQVRLKSETQGAAIYYTTDKTDPVAESKYLYNDETPIIIEEPVTIKAFAVKDGLDNSDVVSFTYTVTDESPVDPEKPEIKTININECTITVPSAIYNKKAGNKQSVTYVTYNYTDAAGNKKNVKFAEDVDYEAAWEKAGNEYKVTLQGKGRSASGRDVDGFIIDKDSKTEPITYKVYTSAKDAGLVNISKAKVDFKADVKANLKTVHYTGYAHEVLYDDLDFSKDKTGLKNVPKDYIRIACRNNINAGKATVSISVDPKYENGKYAGSKTLTFTIKKAALKNSEKATALVEFDDKASAEQQYMGSPIEAKNLKVKPRDGREGSLRKNEDYTVTYKNSVKSGTVTVNVTVKGVGNNLSGSWSGSFKIDQLNLSDKTLTFDTNEGKLPYSPKGAKLGTITVTKDEKVVCTLRAGVDYTAKYMYTDKAKKYDVGGKVTVTITGKGLCKGTTTFKDLEIIKADFDKHINVSDDVTADSDAFKADKSKALSKAVTVTDAAGVKLSLNRDYKIIDIKGVSDTEEKTFTIQPIGKNAKNYTGTKIISYRVAKNLAKDKNFIFNKDLEKKDPLAYDGRNPVKLTTAQIDKYINKNISTDNPNYDTRTYRLGGKNANIEIVPGTYKNNAKKGTAQVTVRGIAGVDGGFYGQKVLKFKIVEK